MADETQTPQEAPTEENAQQIQVRVDQREMETLYANAFHTSAPTPDEIFVSFGINQAIQQEEGQPAQMLLKLEQRVVMTPYTAKRLAIQLSKIIRQHEQQFGELELDVSKRIK